MVKKFTILPQDVDISSGLVWLPAHIVAQSVARSIVQLGQVENAWPRITAEMLVAEPFCHESLFVVQMMLDELAERSFLYKDTTLYYTVTAWFILYCDFARVRPENNNSVIP